MDRFSNTRIGSAATYVAGHRLIDVFISGFGFVVQQHRRAHELPRLAIATLRNILFQPRSLQRITQIRREALDCGHRFSRHPRYRRDARPNRFAVDMHSAGAALRHPTPVFCSSEPKLFTDDPEQRSGWIDVEIDAFAVYGESDHCLFS